MPKVSAVIITRNEAADIESALRSVDWADERIVVDAMSTDATAEIARRHADRVIVRKWPGFSAQKNYAASIASHDWILSIDADEFVTRELAGAIRSALTGEPPCRAYRMARVTWHLGRWVRTTDWYPDAQLRLYDRRAAQWTGAYVHESLVVTGSVGRLQGELQHVPYRNLSDHLETIDRYTTLAAEEMFERGRSAGLLQLAAHPLFAFVRNYVLRGGIRDGAPGFIISAMNAYYVFLKFAKLRELNDPQRASQRGQSPQARPSVRGAREGTGRGGGAPRQAE